MTHAVATSNSIGAEPAGNEQLRPDQVAEILLPELSQISERAGGPVRVEAFGHVKTVPDATTKLLVRDHRQRPFAFILCSRPISPDIAIRGARLAEEVRAVVGERVGSAIIKPLHMGYAQGRSYVILPWHRNTPASRLGRMWHRLRLRRLVLRWLREATAAAVTHHGADDNASLAFELALRHLEKQVFLPNDGRDAVSRSLDRLRAGRWRPRHAVDHNDLWYGNVLWRSVSGTEFPFVIIDWAGANPKGHGMYDLVRIAQSMRISQRALRLELEHHSLALDCSRCDLAGHLLASFGWLHQNIGCFPEERFARMFRGCWQLFTVANDEAQVV